MSLPSEIRPLTVHPRKRGFVYRPIISTDGTTGITEDGEPVLSLPMFASSTDSHIWITNDSASLLKIMTAAFESLDAFNYQIMTSRDDTDGPSFVKSKLTRFGFRCPHDDRDCGCPWRKRRGMHIVWTPNSLIRDGYKMMPDTEPSSLLDFARDIRGFCCDNNLPLPTSLAGIASALLRDKRFWPESRGRVPKATNERIRPFLPGVYSELRADTGRMYHAVAVDQRTAYHVAATEVPMPDPTTLFARGYFSHPDDGPIWALPGDELYKRTVRQPGIVCAVVSVQHRRKFSARPTHWQATGKARMYLWTNELAMAEANGVEIKGLVAAWTSTVADTGLPLYGRWAQDQIVNASPARKLWLKPTLHAAYGLLATRPRELSIGHLHGRGRAAVYLLGMGHQFPVREATLPKHSPPTVNVAALGVLQAEIRKRSLQMAADLEREGATVLHVHADGIHVAGPLPLIDGGRWKLDPLTDLSYLDRVSWIARESSVLPGRDSDTRARVESGHWRAHVHQLVYDNATEPERVTDTRRALTAEFPADPEDTRRRARAVIAARKP